MYTYVHTMEYFGNKKEQSTDTGCNMKALVKTLKTPVTKDHILHNSTYVEYPEWVNLQRLKGGCLGLGVMGVTEG